MDRETILLVHPEADELDRIEALVRPLGLETRRTHDFPGAVKLWQIQPASLVVCTDIDVPEHKPQVVEEVRRATSCDSQGGCSSRAPLRKGFVPPTPSLRGKHLNEAPS